MKKLLIISGKAAALLLLLILLIATLSEFSPIYNFEQPRPFSGPDIYDPYATVDTTWGWKRANFHTHTRVDNILNECPEYPDVVYADYMKLGYDILTFSNHNLLTGHPVDSALQVNVYEHGINLFKLHKLVFEPTRMILHDPLIPFLPSQKQFEYDYLSRNADFICMNHPDRTNMMTPRSMRLLTGYRLMEADSGPSTELERWDEALSAGHYSHCITDDDCHDSGNHRKIGIRCSWQNAPDATWPSLRDALISGRFYSMRVPDFGDGDWEEKYRRNAELPRVAAIGASGDTLRMELSEPAEWIKAVGQGHETLDSLSSACSLTHIMSPDEPYVRFTAHFADGVYIYSNAFARYDSSCSDSPFEVAPHSVNIPLTILFNLGMLALALLCVLAAARLIKH